MPPEESAPQPAPESPTPVTEVSTPEPAQSAPEPSSAPAEAIPPPETGPQGPLPVSETDDRQETQVAQTPTPTAQIPSNEPLPPESEPFDSAPDSAEATTGRQDKPITPEPPSAAAPAPTVQAHPVRDLLNKARIAIQDRKRKNRDIIMTALNTKNKITNDEVEKLLHVSDATATRYLSALEKEGKIIQVGKQGKGILYIKTP